MAAILDGGKPLQTPAQNLTLGPANLPIYESPSKFELGEHLKFTAIGDRVLVEEDEFKSGYECTTCNGKCKVKCDNCGGTGANGVKKCSICDTSGTITCPSCKGKGGILVAPEISQQRPATGNIVSVGLDCKVLKVGQSVLYSNFAGYVVDLNRAGAKVSLRILHESEILCIMEGHLTLTNFKGKSDIAQFNP